MQLRSIVAVPVGAVFLLVFLALAFASSRADALERQHRVGVGLGFALLKVGDKASVSAGLGGGFSYSYGLTDQFNLVAEGGYARVATSESSDATTPRTRPTDVWNGGIGVTYVLDVLRWVPYFGLLGAGYALTGGTIDRPKFVPGAVLALGLDYHINRSFAVGVAFRQHMLLGDISTYPSFTNVFARAEYVWGW
jgi:hypothetical protein